jgi:uncharacterized membrane protein YfcA
MDAAATLITVVAGLAMGAINNVAGGAGVLGLLALEHACGLPIAVANPSTRPGAVGVGLFAWLGFLRSGLRPAARAWRLGAFAVPGAFFGDLLAVELPVLAFHGYLATVLVALLWQQLRRRHGSDADRPLKAAWLGAAGCFVIGVHMGFVQVGTGLVATLVLQSTYSRDLIATNIAKAAVVILASVASVLGFVLAPLLRPGHGHVIAWEPALWLALGTAVGSYLGSGWTVARGAAAVRRVVVLVALYSFADQVVHIVALLRS